MYMKDFSHAEIIFETKQSSQIDLIFMMLLLKQKHILKLLIKQKKDLDGKLIKDGSMKMSLSIILAEKEI